MISGSDGRAKSSGKTHVPELKPKPRFLKEDLSHKKKDLLQKDKKSLWDWKPLKALSHIRSRRFNCCFSLQVHSIEGLPLSFNDISLCVHWKTREVGLQTHAARVFEGTVDFEETLTHKCSVYGSRNGPHHLAKYEAKHFLLYASVVGDPELDLGKHRIDLTRLFPLTLEELEEEKSSGKWTTSFKLSGKAKGATLNVSFGFSVIGDDPVESGGVRNAPQVLNLKQNRPIAIKPVNGFDRGHSHTLRRDGSLPGIPNQSSHLLSQSVEDVKILHEVLPTSRSELSTSVNLLYQKLDEDKFNSLGDSKPEFEVFSENVEPLKPISNSISESAKKYSENTSEDPEFSVIDKGIEMSGNEDMKLDDDSEKAFDDSTVETIKTAEINMDNEVAPEVDIKPNFQGEAYGNFKDDLLVDEYKSKKSDTCTKQSLMEELEQAFHNLSIMESERLGSPPAKCQSPEQANYMEVKSNYKASKMGKSLSLDDVTESVASEFLSMLGIDHSPFELSSDSNPESPREQLLRQFEKDALAGGNCIFGYDSGNEKEVEFGYDAPTSPGLDFSEDFNLSSVVHAAEVDHQKMMQAMKGKTRAKMLEDLETETLMREWGLNEKAFQSSPNSSGGFGSPVDLLPEESLMLPPLGEGLGPFIQTRDGGFLRSMNPSLFRNAKNGGSLIMQVSSPVVVPAEMGSGIMEILQRLASVGIEKLSMQANKLMPLEDVTGKTMHQVAWEAAPCLEATERQGLLQHESVVGQETFGGTKKGRNGHKSNNLNMSSLSGQIGSEYVSLEDLAPLAMDKIEALSIEGLRIQSGMSDEDAPSNICPQSIGEISALEGKGANTTGSLGLEGAAGLQLLDIKDSGDDVDGLMGLSITLDEWMRLDAGIVDDEDEISERTSKILAAHHATCTDLITGAQNRDKKRGKGSGRRCGLLGNNFTVALMVQLRDPLRNYEPVGAPMLALIQVERVFVPPKPKIYCTVSEKRNHEEEEEESETVVKEEIKDETVDRKDEEEGIPQFKITEVHVAGLKTEPGKKLWGTPKQQQSGSRWLLASGMGKSSKHPFMKSKAVTKSTPQMTTTVQPGDTLWSISSRVHGTGAKWKELAALNPHIRNPNVIFPNETIRLC
ncbi:PREDICTED: protein PLASTID MOVEMENT IMPAIRED 1-RELATED 1-like isoform X2 [Nelumbo nucifera]|nr:PREDICTED: protein PLASTID MOVEMENT IMPAIRED 1-RELATED 1-like isoform X2 [Nelumbo nucifera]